MFQISDLIGFGGYFVSAIAYLAAALLVLAFGGRHYRARWLALASASVSLWAGVLAYGYLTGIALAPLTDALELVRMVAWLVFLTGLAVGLAQIRLNWLALLGLLVAAGLTLLIRAFEHYSPLTAYHLVIVPKLIASVVGLVLVENIYRKRKPEDRWGNKYLCIGLGGLFALELFFFADALLYQTTNWQIFHARGVAFALILPLLLVSSRRENLWKASIALNQSSVFYSTALFASGCYVVLMASVGFYLREFGGSWGGIAQLAFLFGSFVLLAILLTSGSVRARLNVLVRSHFFKYKYDYRVEWLNFTRRLTESDNSDLLEVRIIKAIADIFESPAGGLWSNTNGQLVVAAAWNMSVPSVGRENAKDLVSYMAESGLTIDLKATSGRRGPEIGPELPAEIQNLSHPWLLVPLIHHGALKGLVVLSEPRAPQKIIWEDLDLLKTIGLVAASYLAERAAADRLAEVEEFDKFNRRSAFLIHDLKNLVSQLSLVSSNMESHGHEVEFRQDLDVTIKNVVSKMKNLMARFSPDAPDADLPIVLSRVDLAAILRSSKLVDRNQLVTLNVEDDMNDYTVTADRERLSGLFDHLIDNAVEAVQDQDAGGVRIGLFRTKTKVIIEITDNGPGMDREFVKTELFKPFRSTKANGMGLGAFQCRAYARELRGDLVVVTSPGAGTTIRILLPASAQERDEAEIVARRDMV